MTTPAESVSARRRRLIGLIGRAADELAAIEVHDHRVAQHRGTIHVPPNEDVIDTTTHAGTIRAWAAQNGHNVAATGRVPKAVRAAYAQRPQNEGSDT